MKSGKSGRAPTIDECDEAGEGIAGPLAGISVEGVSLPAVFTRDDGSTGALEQGFLDSILTAADNAAGKVDAVVFPEAALAPSVKHTHSSIVRRTVPRSDVTRQWPALALAGVTRDTAAPAGGAIFHDERGEPTGVLQENANALIDAVGPAPTDEQMCEAARLGQREAWRRGIVGFESLDAFNERVPLASFERMRQSGELGPRVSSGSPRAKRGRVAPARSAGGRRGGEGMRAARGQALRFRRGGPQAGHGNSRAPGLGALVPLTPAAYKKSAFTRSMEGSED